MVDWAAVLILAFFVVGVPVVAMLFILISAWRRREPRGFDVLPEAVSVPQGCGERDRGHQVQLFQGSAPRSDKSSFFHDFQRVARIRQGLIPHLQEKFHIARQLRMCAIGIIGGVAGHKGQLVLAVFAVRNELHGSVGFKIAACAGGKYTNMPIKPLTGCPAPMPQQLPVFR